VEIITTASRLGAVVASALKQPRVALDIESNGFYRYPERICLVQLATADGVFLIDPLDTLDPQELAPLGELLAAPSVEKIFHAADYDVRSLQRDWGFRIRPLFDTGIAAAFAGSERLGLGAVLQEYLGVEVNKSKKLQRADWTLRPLSDEQVRYAADDVIYLERLTALLRQRLAELGRTDWVAEECERLANVEYTPPDIEMGFLSVKGSGALDGKGLAALQSLYMFREVEALRRDRPPFKVFSDAAMLALAANPRSDLSKVKGLGRYARGRYSSGVRRALREGIEAGPFKRPKRPFAANGHRATPDERSSARKRLKLLKEWRSSTAKRLALDPGLVWPLPSLDRLSLRPRELDAEMTDDAVRDWQRRQLGESLAAALKRM